MIKLTNDGPELVSTTYWESPKGEVFFAFTANAGVMRLLVPRNSEDDIQDMIRGCDYVVISTIPNPQVGRLSIEFLFEDHSPTPFALHLCADGALGFFPAADPKPVERSLTLWVEGPRKVATLRAYSRQVPFLPWLKPLKALAGSRKN